MKKKFNVRLARKHGNFIGKNVYISPDVIMGSNNYFGNNCVIKRGTIIGDKNKFGNGIVIGELPREFITGSYKKKNITEFPKVVIGNGNLFESYDVIQASLETVTKIENNVRIGAFSHICHDSCIYSDVVIASHCIVAGYCIIFNFANLGMGAKLHQRTVIGAYSMLAAGSVVINHIAPAATIAGVPAQYKKVNRIGLERQGFSENDIMLIQRWLECRHTLHEVPKSILSYYIKFLDGIKIWKRKKEIIP